jgi:hypothetical protein
MLNNKYQQVIDKLVKINFWNKIKLP